MAKSKNTRIPLAPFPSQGEIIRAIANGLGTKFNNRKINDYARNMDTDYKLRDEMIDVVIFDPIKKYICFDLALELRDLTRNMCDEYLKVVKTIALPAVTRNEALPVLIEHFFAAYFNRFLFSESRTWLESNVLEIPLQNISTIDALINGQNEYIKSWSEGLEKGERDKLRKWQKKGELPNVIAIKLLFKNIPDEFQKLKRVLLIARSIDFMKRSELSRQCIKAKPVSNLELIHFPKKRIQTSETLCENLEDVRNSLYKQHQRGAGEQQSIRQKLNELSKEYFSLNLEALGFLVDLYMYEARWQLFSGENEKALENYMKAFEYSLYRCGECQLNVIKESIVVAAKLDARTFLTRLKNQAIVFDIYEAPFENDTLDTQVNSKKSRSKLNIVEDWEVQLWCDQFHTRFPASMFFDPEKAGGIDDPFGMPESDIKNIKPDYMAPDKNLIIPVIGRMKKQPQLVWFVNQNKPEIVQRLLEAGASVNQYSDSGDTAILMALLHMDTRNHRSSVFSKENLDSRCFDIINSYPHSRDTVNRRTSKKRLLPLMCAVGSGRVEVVKKVLDMGAEVDRRGELNNMTSLYYCVQLIKETKNPNGSKNKLHLAMKYPTQKMKHASRRSSGGMPDIPSGDPLFQSIQNALIESTFHQSLLNVGKLYEIAMVLLEAGADSNAEHNIEDPVRRERLKGYTPLMFAAEFDDRLYTELLSYGGDPEKTYECPETGETIS